MVGVLTNAEAAGVAMFTNARQEFETFVTWQKCTLINGHETQLLQLSDYSQLLGFYGYVNRPKVLCFIPGGQEKQMFSL